VFYLDIKLKLKRIRDSELHFGIGKRLGGMSIPSFDSSAEVNVPDINAFEFIPGGENIVETKTTPVSQFFRDCNVGVYASD
jgi:hypothetical protein